MQRTAADPAPSPGSRLGTAPAPPRAGTVRRMFYRRLLLAAASLTACSTVDPENDEESLTAPQSATEATGGSNSGAPTTGASGPVGTGSGDDTGAQTSNLTADPSASDSDTDPGSTGADAGLDYGMPGPHPVGNTRFTVANGERQLLVEVWYPADASAAADATLGHPIEDFVPPGPDHDMMVTLLADLSPHGQIGTRLQTASALDAPPAPGGPWPLIIFSHCHNCVRFSAFTVMERLASHGFVVAAPDHQGNTLFDQGAAIDENFLVVRLGDVQAVLDAVLAAQDPLPAPLHDLADPDRVGALGHSYGAATTGRFAQVDPRIKAALPIAAPVENPIFPNTHVADIHVPLLMVLAEEDNSIQKIGNNLIASNFNAANPPVRLVSVADAGHWNFTDICGLTMAFDAGCGDGIRQSDNTPFVYLDINTGREVAASYSLAFFDRWLRDNSDADAFLDAATPADVVTVESRL